MGCGKLRAIADTGRFRIQSRDFSERAIQFSEEAFQLAERGVRFREEAAP
jgi:hypothetical protein